MVVGTVAKKSGGKKSKKTRARARARDRDGAIRAASMGDNFVSARIPGEWVEALDNLPPEYVGGRALNKSTHIRIAVQEYLIRKHALKG